MNAPATYTPVERLQLAGYAILPVVYTAGEVAALLACLEAAPAASPNFRRSQDVFAIRNLLGEIPELWPLLDTPALRELLGKLFSSSCHLTKAIYFDKPAGSNWLVAWHQDLMINVDRHADGLLGFGPWTTKAGWVAVQPPSAVLENTITIRCARRARRWGHAHEAPATARLQPQHQRPAAPGYPPRIFGRRAACRAGLARAPSGGNSLIYWANYAIILPGRMLFCRH
jgi:hypothetical protein